MSSNASYPVISGDAAAAAGTWDDKTVAEKQRILQLKASGTVNKAHLNEWRRQVCEKRRSGRALAPADLQLVGDYDCGGAKAAVAGGGRRSGAAAAESYQPPPDAADTAPTAVVWTMAVLEMLLLVAMVVVLVLLFIRVTRTHRLIAGHVERQSAFRLLAKPYFSEQ